MIYRPTRFGREMSPRVSRSPRSHVDGPNEGWPSGPASMLTVPSSRKGMASPARARRSAPPSADTSEKSIRRSSGTTESPRAFSVSPSGNDALAARTPSMYRSPSSVLSRIPNGLGFVMCVQIRTDAPPSPPAWPGGSNWTSVRSPGACSNRGGEIIRASGPNVAQPTPQIDMTTATTMTAELFPNRMAVLRTAVTGARVVPNLDLMCSATALHESRRAAADKQQRSRLRYLGERELILRLPAVEREQVDDADTVVDPTRVHIRFGERDERLRIA